MCPKYHGALGLHSHDPVGKKVGLHQHLLANTNIDALTKLTQNLEVRVAFLDEYFSEDLSEVR